ncbi:putative Eukaryotic protein of unknown function (DUF866) [Trypanosoma vivax]|uniref:DUF866 domain-containing protein n=1 Tax=Trypanosoma vivax (strain Y486) TaxID=1055687 RepID=G0TRE5_TRYVY|nr:hypothetical protein TRVL_07060 [Trypanosoma vivax]KAH8603973.1 putative Eukaryotic protein of unknown function (DUF866) [Trypanosoma vivax]CCC46509.1 conserved hypothetical protein [Trypanosoma vivax Y486]
MPLFSVRVSAETEGVTAIRPTRPRPWGLKVICDSCKEQSPHFVYVDEDEQCDSGGGGTRNTVFKCASCKTQISISIDTDSYGVYTPDEAQRNDGAAVLTLDVRGGTPVELEVDDRWVVSSEGETFDGVDLSTDWMEYDEKSATSVSVSNFTVSFARKRGK